MDAFKAPSIIPSRKKKSLPTEQETKLTEHDVSPVGEDGSQAVAESAEHESVEETRETESKENETEHKAESYAEEKGLRSEPNSEELPTNDPPNEQLMKGAELQNEDKESETKVVHSGPSPPTPDLPYTEPHWSGRPSAGYSLTVIKNGSVLEEIDLSSLSFMVFGRLPVCDVSLEHPSISRYHAVLQYRPTTATQQNTNTETEEGRSLPFGTPNEAGFYVYDLNSTHGSFLNKSKLQPRVYYRVRVGQMVRFGGSSRLFVLEMGGGGVEGHEVVEAEAEAEIRELVRQKEEMEARQKKIEEERERLAKEREEMGATWGMVMDEVARKEDEEEEISIDPEKEAYYKDDPKKALKKYFDREGLELEYDVEEEGTGRDKTYIIRVTLPIETGGGQQLVVEEIFHGKKKEAVVQCALKACRILDSNDMLRAASQRRQRVTKNWEENDYYDSDEDSFLDRTGDLEKKRRQRMKRVGKLEDKAETYESLVTRLDDVMKERQKIENRLNKSKNSGKGGGERDSLDEFMNTVSSQLDPTTISRLKRQTLHLKKEEEMIRKMMKAAKPTEMPSLKPRVSEEEGHRETAGLPHPTGGPQPSSPGISVTTDPISQVEEKRQELPVSPIQTTAPSTSVGESISGPHPPSRSSRRRRRRSSSSSSGPETTAEAVGGGGEGTQKKPRVLGPALPSLPERDMPEQQKETNEATDSGFASWLPPDNQTGDGKTHLNEKYGY